MPQKIICPQCKSEISIDDVLTHQIEDSIRQQFEREQAKKETELQEREKLIQERQQKIEFAKENLQQIVNKRVEENLQQEKEKLKQIIKADAEKETASEVKLLRDQLTERDTKLAEARNAELELRKEKIQLEEAKKSFEIEKQRQLDAERQQIIETAAKKASEDQQFKLMELTKQLNDALKVNEELSRKLQQGSQQMQGEVLELELEDLLRREFPHDEIVPVGKGENGADVTQIVCDKFGRRCGIMIWESKRTKNWTEGWIQKLKDDQLRAKADIAVIVSAVLPKDQPTFGLRDGIWVTDFDSITGLALALRMNLLQLAALKATTVGKNEKMEILYSYLTGPEFKHKIEAIVSTFTNMKIDLDKEKNAYVRIWEKREKQISRVIENTIGMYGDLEGLTGDALPKIEMLELPSDVNEESV